MESSNPFYKTANTGYGTNWQASAGANPIKIDNTPEYREVGDRELALKNSMKTYKHQMMKEMRENGELDTQVYDKIKRN